jgi:hypothetical protein
MLYYGANVSGEAWRSSLSLDGDGLTFDTANSAVTFPATVDDNNWHHAAWVHSQNGTTEDIQIYLDGNLLPGPFVANSAGPSDRNVDTSDADPIFIGGANDQGNPTPSPDFSGAMDDVRIYDRALTGPQIQQLFAEQSTTTLQNMNLGFP